MPDLNNPMAAAVEDYFNHLSFRKLPDLYETFLQAMEKPLIESVLKAVRGHQIRAAEVLGMNRATLSRMCRKYNILPQDYYIAETRLYRHNIKTQ